MRGRIVGGGGGWGGCEGGEVYDGDCWAHFFFVFLIRWGLGLGEFFFGQKKKKKKDIR